MERTHMVFDPSRRDTLRDWDRRFDRTNLERKTRSRSTNHFRWNDRWTYSGGGIGARSWRIAIFIYGTSAIAGLTALYFATCIKV